MLVELLVAPGCPARQDTEELLQKILDELAPEVRPRVIVVDTAVKAIALKFPGSPTVRINGRDIEPEADKSLNYGLG
ncbi:DUF2703 domain-containing protein [Desulfoferrobacter suflitae]|uniref:DUF2703 domain-containing protein n=1 Tax=Desulfoferrobacter suflitae TaxID=2865782 RepID=UPI0021643CCB|nr:DUF2703 domain-containing protein [Desulfoferrobacter suflitae]MCK8603678.1 DUF2703 domain-containing protein [Desulfoferrobacter suflitae]